MMAMMDSSTGMVYWIPAEAGAGAVHHVTRLAPITPYRTCGGIMEASLNILWTHEIRFANYTYYGLVQSLPTLPLQPYNPNMTAVNSVIMNTTVFVRGIPWEATKETVENHFCIYGPIQSCHVIRHKDASTNKGIAFVKFHDVVAAQHAVNCNNPGMMDQRVIHVEYARPKHKHSSSSASFPSPTSEQPAPAPALAQSWLQVGDQHLAIPTTVGPPVYLDTSSQLVSPTFFSGMRCYMPGTGAARPASNQHIVNTTNFYNPIMAVTPPRPWILTPGPPAGGHVLGYPHPANLGSSGTHDTSWSLHGGEVPSRLVPASSWYYAGGLVYAPGAAAYVPQRVPAATIGTYIHEADFSDQWANPEISGVAEDESATFGGSGVQDNTPESWGQAYQFETHDDHSGQALRGDMGGSMFSCADVSKVSNTMQATHPKLGRNELLECQQSSRPLGGLSGRAQPKMVLTRENADDHELLLVRTEEDTESPKLSSPRRKFEVQYPSERRMVAPNFQAEAVQIACGPNSKSDQISNPPQSAGSSYKMAVLPVTSSHSSADPEEPDDWPQLRPSYASRDVSHGLPATIVRDSGRKGKRNME